MKRKKSDCVGFNGSGRPSGKPTQNAFIERFNGSFRRKVLNVYLFHNLAQVPEVVESWLSDYNTELPHQALGYMTPLEFKLIIETPTKI